MEVKYSLSLPPLIPPKDCFYQDLKILGYIKLHLKSIKSSITQYVSYVPHVYRQKSLQIYPCINHFMERIINIFMCKED